MLAEILKVVAVMSLSGGALTLILAAAHPWTKRVFSAAWNYYIWLAVLLVMLCPARIALPKRQSAPERTAIVTTKMQSAADDAENNAEQTRIAATAVQSDNAARAADENPSAARTFFGIPAAVEDNADMLARVWLTAAVLLLGSKLLRYALFCRGLRKSSRIISCPEAALYTRKKLTVRKSDKIISPLVVGVFRPTLLLPDTELNPERLRYILLHESTHLNRNDILYKWLVTLVKCAHWFNPAVYFIAARVNAECEISCDFAVVKNMTRAEETGYVQTILALLSNSNRRGIPLTTGMTGGKRILRRRFEMIRNKRVTGKVTRVLSTALATVITAATIFAGGVFADGMLGGAPEWAKGYIEAADRYSLFMNKDANNIDFGKELTRSEFCELAANVCINTGITLMSDGHKEERLTDVTQYNNPDILCMYCMGIVPSKTDTLFAPNDVVTRENAAVFLQNLFDYVNLGAYNGVYSPDASGYSFADDADISDNARHSVYGMYEQSIFNGDGSGRFNPKKTMTVAEGVTALTRLCGQIHSCYDNAEGLVYNQLQSVQNNTVNGHNPWRLNPDEVVLEYAKNNGIPTDGQITELPTEENRFRCLIEYIADANRYTIELFRPIVWDKNGAWVVKSVTSETLAEPFSDAEVAAARAVVEEYYRALASRDRAAVFATMTNEDSPNIILWNDEQITLNDIRYNPHDNEREDYIKYGRGGVNGTKYEDVIVFKVDYTVSFPEGSDKRSPLNEGKYTDWNMILIRDGKTGQWLIDDQGY